MMIARPDRSTISIVSDELAPGTILLDKYRVDGLLGRGGMGVVLAATHLHLKERVAIKLLRADALRDRDVVARFLREAQAAARLKSEHVARVIDVGSLPWGAPYIVMEFLDGVDLAGLIAKHGRLRSTKAVDYVLQACEALAEAHALGIVHRDLKPANLFVTQRPGGAAMVKVLDFGISKATANGELALTSTNAVIGTPLYMSPEQMQSAARVDARTDQWALGAVLFECLSGAPPFKAETFAALCIRVATDPTPALTAPAPEGLARVIEKCLAKEPSARFASVAALAAALAPYAGDRRQAAISVERASAVLGEPPPRAAPLQDPVRRPRANAAEIHGAVVERPARTSSRRALWIGASFAVGATIALIVILKMRSERGRKTQKTTHTHETPAAGIVEPTIVPLAPSVKADTRSGEVPRMLAIEAVFASSTHAAAAGYRFDPANVVDGDLQTSWQPAETSKGRASAWVRLEFEATTITQIGIGNGFQTRDRYGDEFLLNSRVASGRLRFSDGTEHPVTLSSDARGITTIDVPDVVTSSVTLLVDSTHRGTKWRDLAISEIEVWGFSPK